MAQQPFDEQKLKETHSPERMDETMRITSVKSWMIVLSFGVFIIAVVLWGFFGTIYHRVHGYGILLPEPSQIFLAVSRGNGLLEEIYTRPGDYVIKGQKVARVNQDILVQKITHLQKIIARLKSERDFLNQYIKNQRTTVKNYLQSVRSSIQQKNQNAKQLKTFLDKLLVGLRKLRETGAVTLIRLQDTQNNLFNAVEKVNELQNDIINLKVRQIDYRLRWFQLESEINVKLIDKEDELSGLMEKYNENRWVLSPVDGIVDQLLSARGNFMTPGHAVLTIAEQNKNKKDLNYEVLAFFNPEKGKRILPKMRAFISPTTVNKYRYGSIKSEVEYIDDYPLSHKAIVALVGNDDLAKTLVKKGGSFLASAELLKDKSTVTGFRWTSNNGPPFKVTSGTLCNVDVAIEKQRPVTLVLPFLRHLIKG
ncbi:MAG: NHLP bacteriocin system secretion protein [Gammaproteobacteria bacterium]|nr:NHLP bacteriocin system secretion protein [Gammaproteobacteria bacterium]